MLVCTECRLRLQTTSSGSKLQLECGLWAGDPALRSRIPGVSTYSGVQEILGLWESMVETLWGGANSTLCSGIVRLWSWIYSFCDKRSTTLVFDDSESYSIPIHCGVPQGSPLSPILFLFYISELHETVHTPSSGVSALGFADNTNLLAFGHSLKSNLLKLKNTHHKYLSWAARHGIVFSPEKYEILHFSRRRSDNLQLKLRLGNVILKPKEEV